jgi:hypothetical protein
MGANGAAVVINFSLNPGSPSHISQSYHLPVGILFRTTTWDIGELMVVVSSLATLVVGLFNYFKTIRMYGERRAVVQVGFKVQSVVILVGCFIISVTILFIATKPI